MTNRQVFGFVAEILDSRKMSNTDPMYRFQAVIQIVYFKANGQQAGSWFRGRAAAFRSNALVTGGFGAMLGSVVFGIRDPTSGAHLTAQLESWGATTFRRWKRAVAGEPPNRPISISTMPRWAIYPFSGGSGIDRERRRWAIAAVRLRPPISDTHLFHREMDVRPGKISTPHRKPRPWIRAGPKTALTGELPRRFTPMFSPTTPG